MKEPRTIFLTGATGHIGSALLEELLAGGHAVFALARHPGSLRTHQESRLHIVPGDITHTRFGLDSERYRMLATKCDCVIHCAAKTAFHDANGELYRTNVLGTNEVMAFARHTTFRRITYFSTAFACSEKEGSGFRNEYERTKYIAEKAVRDSFEQGHLVGKILRPSIVVNTDVVTISSPKDGLHRLLSLLVRLKAKNRALSGSTRLSADPNVRMNFVSLAYVVQATMQLCMTTQGDGGAYSLIDTRPHTNAEVLQMISEVMGMDRLHFEDLRGLPSTELTSWERHLADLLALYNDYLFDHSQLETGGFDSLIDQQHLPPAGLTLQDFYWMAEQLRGRYGINSTRSCYRQASKART